jgi:uncharacterized membrane protein YgdD (TMEM256/DUF423 family)
MHHRAALAWAGVLGATGVILGALGVHTLRPTLEASGMREVWDTASHFQLLHAAALLGLAGWLKATPPPGNACASWALRLLVLGTLLFAGSLYLLAFSAPHWIGILTPLGGLTLVAGWILAACAAFKG